MTLPNEDYSLNPLNQVLVSYADLKAAGVATAQILS